MKIRLSWQVVAILVFFLITRLYIWVYKPTTFTQILYVYMPYAHLWASGELPYLHQWYEYPPLTIPFFYLPHLIDMATNHSWYHLNYSEAYRGSLLIIDTLLFSIIWATLKRLKVSPKNIALSLIYYSLTTAKSHDFIYDSFDLIFAFMVTFGYAAPILWKHRGFFIGWLNFFAAIAIKYVNAPLGMLSLLNQRTRLNRALIEIALAATLIWGIPVAFFRSSLLVTLEYHKQRGIQVESTAATIARTFNQWTNSEHFVEVAKAYDIQGPISNQLKRIFSIVFPASMLVYIGYYAYKILRSRSPIPLEDHLYIALGFISLFMVVSPVLSTPYLLWHIPFVAIIPLKQTKRKFQLMLLSLLVVTAGMTNVPDLPVGPLSTHILIGWIKAVGFSAMFILTVKNSQITGTAGERNI